MTERPTVGRLTVPFMVDTTRVPISFAVLDKAHVAICAESGRCGVCGRKIRRGPIAFIGPDDGRTCFADPWMHRRCAETAMTQCPFLAGKRGWRDPAAGADPLTSMYAEGMVVMLAYNWRSHLDHLGAWHFEALGPLEKG